MFLASFARRPAGETGLRRRSLRYVPFALTTSRIGLALLLPSLVITAVPRPLLGALAALAFLTDWLDGVTARRLGVVTPWLRQYDGAADVVFYLTALATGYALEPAALGPFLPWVAVLLGVEVFVQLWHYRRWRRVIATHSWACKACAVALSAALTVLLGYGATGGLLFVAFVVGSIAYADVVLIVAFAQHPPVDVVSCWHVWNNREAI